MDLRCVASTRCLWLAAGVLAGCGQAADGEGVGTSRAGILYGTDGREEAWEASNETLRSIAATANVAILAREDVTVASDGTLELPPDSLEHLVGVCPDERFAAQPAAARCSGVLMGPNLVLTATHCLRTLPCEDLALMRGFAYQASGELRELREEDMARCSRVIHSAPTRLANGTRSLDYAWLELDRGFASVFPLSVAGEGAIAADTAAVLIGHGEGVPVKIDEGGTVLEVEAPLDGQLKASFDNFAGGSGAGVFDASGALLGIAVNGASDFEPGPEGCLRSRMLGDREGVEVVTFAARAVAGLCGVAPGSEPCGPHDSPATCMMSSRSGRRFTFADPAALVVALGLCTWRRVARRSSRRGSGRT